MEPAIFRSKAFDRRRMYLQGRLRRFSRLATSLRKRHVTFLLEYRAWILIAVLALALSAGYGFTKMQVDVSSRPFFPRTAPETLTLEAFQNTFGTQDTILLGVEFEETLFAGNSMDHLKRLANGLADISGIGALLSLLNADSLTEHFVNTRDWEGLKSYAQSNPRYRSTLVSDDGRSALLALSPSPVPGDPGRGDALVRDLRRLLQDEQRPDCRYYLTGLPVMQADFSGFMMKDQRTFGLAAVLVLSLFMFFLFRTLWGVLIPLGCGGLTLCLTMGVFFLTGHQINLLNGVLFLLILVISVANSIHLINHFLEQYKAGRKKEEALQEALTGSLPPCLLSGVTTVIGFGSLGTSNIPAVAEFVPFFSLGIFLSFLFTATVVPILLYQMVTLTSARKVPLDPDPAGWILHKALWLLGSHRMKIAMVALLLSVGLGYEIGRVRTNMDVMSSFPEDSSLRKATDFLEEKFIGAHVLEVMISTAGEDVLSMDNIQRIDAFEKFVNLQPEVNRTLSVLQFAGPHLDSYLKAPAELQNLMPGKASIRSILPMLSHSQRETLQAFVGGDGRDLRVTAFLQTGDSRTVSVLAQRIQDQGARILGPEMQVACTGELLLLSQISTSLVTSLLQSLLLAFGIIFLVLGLLLRSPKAVLVSLLPNLLPIASLFGIMGWLGIPLTVPTSMVACIVLGLAVDDTIYFLHDFQARRKRKESPEEAARNALRTVGRAMIFTSSILCIGFLLGTLSQFDLIAQFGFLAGITVLLALLSDLTLLPVCLLAMEGGRAGAGKPVRATPVRFGLGP